MDIRIILQLENNVQTGKIEPHIIMYVCIFLAASEVFKSLLMIT